ncbi:25405_t:CDS:2, partial [Gigaspora rosea]
MNINEHLSLMNSSLRTAIASKLYRRPRKTRFVYMLFNQIGEDKIERLKSYNANTIARLTRAQIDEIIDDQQNDINKNEDITSSTLIQLANFYDIPSPELKIFYSSGIDAYPRVYSIESKKLVEKLKGHVKNNGDSKISNSESDNDKLKRDLLITCGFDKCVKIWGSDESCRELMKDLIEEGEKKRNQG